MRQADGGPERPGAEAAVCCFQRFFRAPLAQSEEQVTSNDKVAGSSPAGGAGLA